MKEYPALDNTELISLLKEDNEGAFTEVYNRYWKLLYITANSIVQDGEAARDAVQNVYVALWQRRRELTIQDLKAYLQQAVRFQVLKAIKEGKANKEFYNRLGKVTADIVYENFLLFKEQQALLLKVLDTLPDDCRQIFMLSREDNLTYKQIAAQLNISEKTVEKKMSVCLKQIRTALQRNLDLSLTLFITLLLCYPD